MNKNDYPKGACSVATELGLKLLKMFHLSGESSDFLDTLGHFPTINPSFKYNIYETELQMWKAMYKEVVGEGGGHTKTKV